MENFSITILIILLHFAIFVASEQLSYVPKDNITLCCGDLNDSNGPDGRFWVADKNSKFGPFESYPKKSEAYEADRQGSSVDIVPCMTAQVSSSEFKYSFPVTPGQKFVRLYFHPATYKSFDGSKAFFSVKAGPFTLLKNFSALPVAESFSRESFPREFWLNIEENQVLDLIFTLSPSASNGTYAFVNGIEIVSMPTNLYFTQSASSQGVLFVGQTFRLLVDNYTALETVYRLNVGGKSISTKDDNGMFRFWSDDFDYMSTGSHVSVNKTVLIEYPKFQRYAAPEEVYRTARSMGPNRTYNEEHNLTWGLPVDSDFKYLVRLHFCEFQNEITAPGDRKFEVFINSQTAEPLADIIMWTGHSEVPIYKDYVLLISKKGKENKQNITIDLHPVMTKYFDVIVNGIEVLKLNNTDGNLAGPNPEAPLASPPPESSNSIGGKSKTKRKALTAGEGCVAGLLVLVSLLTCMVRW